MSAYSTIVVGTDGSKSSMLAVERAAKIAAAFNATLVIGCAYYETKEDASKTLRQDSVTVLGTDPAQENLDKAAEHARAIGAPTIQTAIRRAAPQDIVLIAGKGHETYQDVQGEKHHFSDFEIAEAALDEAT